jgi:hypothetical protein
VRRSKGAWASRGRGLEPEDTEPSISRALTRRRSASSCLLRAWQPGALHTTAWAYRLSRDTRALAAGAEPAWDINA